MQAQKEISGSMWQRLTDDLPNTTEEISAEIAKVLAVDGYLHLQWPMSFDNYESIAGRIGTIILRSDVKVDLELERKQEQVRTVKGRANIYSPSPLGFHTDPHADLVSWYCVEQDETGGDMLMLQACDLEQHFSPEELDTLRRVELMSPGRDANTGAEIFTPVPLLRKQNSKNHIFYASWLLRDSYDSEASQVLQKFVAYLKYKEETQMISLPVKRQDTVFIDNGRMLHGRVALPADSRRHLVRFYLRAATN
jgi:hypothetical protein